MTLLDDHMMYTNRWLLQHDSNSDVYQLMTLLNDHIMIMQMTNR